MDFAAPFRFAAHRWRILSAAAARCAAEKWRFFLSGAAAAGAAVAASAFLGGRPRRLAGPCSAASAVAFLNQKSTDLFRSHHERW